jgi:hypothetical protein
MFSCKHFIVLGFTMRTTTHFDLIFGISYDSRLSFLRVIPVPYVEKMLLVPLNSLAPLLKIIDHTVSYGVYSILLFYMTILCQYHTDLYLYSESLFSHIFTYLLF